VCELITAAPARIFNLEPRKGRIQVGADADLTLVDLDRERVMDAKDFASYADYSPYDGWKLKGWPVKTIVRGVTVMDDNKVVGPPGFGEYLWRTLGAQS
jgi:dihydropyrimidinase